MDVAIAQAKPTDEAMHDLFERQDELFDEAVRQFRSGVHASMPWKTVPAARLLKIWRDSARDGFVRDVKGLDMIAGLFVDNVVRIMINNEVSGHSCLTPGQACEDRLEPDEIEAFVEWAIETDGGWRISDYGIEPLFRLAALVSGEENPERKLVLLDMMLNVIHPRSDLASWFVEGGSKTLLELSGEERPGTEPEPAPRM